MSFLIVLEVVMCFIAIYIKKSVVNETDNENVSFDSVIYSKQITKKSKRNRSYSEVLNCSYSTYDLPI